jgi:hypothetical protein
LFYIYCNDVKPIVTLILFRHDCSNHLPVLWWCLAPLQQLPWRIHKVQHEVQSQRHSSCSNGWHDVSCLSLWPGCA